MFFKIKNCPIFNNQKRNQDYVLIAFLILSAPVRERALRPFVTITIVGVGVGVKFMQNMAFPSRGELGIII